MKLTKGGNIALPKRWQGLFRRRVAHLEFCRRRQCLVAAPSRAALKDRFRL